MKPAKDQILSTVKMLLAARPDIPRHKRVYIDKWLIDLSDILRHYKNGGSEPNWKELGQQINKICQMVDLPEAFKEDSVESSQS